MFQPKLDSAVSCGVSVYLYVWEIYFPISSLIFKDWSGHSESILDKQVWLADNLRRHEVQSQCKPKKPCDCFVDPV